MKNGLKIFAASFLLLAFFAGAVKAEEDAPVKVVFDTEAKRVDIKSGETLPNYTEAVRGSVEFFYSRLDKPEKGFWYFFDGRAFQSIESLALIRNMPGLGGWAILGTRGWRGSSTGTVKTNPMSICEIGHHAVSFVPINPKTKKPDQRIYVKLDDIHMMQWHELDHWVANTPQEKLKAEKGKRF